MAQWALLETSMWVNIQRITGVAHCANVMWPDLEFLNLLVDQSPTTRIMVLLTCRPEFTSPWPGRAHLTPFTLTRLPRPQVERMVASVAGERALPREVVQQIVAKTDGVPLFVEELTKTVLESGLLQEHENHYELIGPLPALAIPATLQDSLMARLDRLSAVKTVAQLGATIGRQFAYDLLQAISPLDEGTLQQGLRQLVEAELLYQRGMPPQATYIFKHALIQDTAHQSLLRSTRQQYHQRIAQVLVEQFPDTTETQPEVLAHHYTEADHKVQAVQYWQRASERAVARSAHQEAIAHLTAGLAVLATMPENSERAEHELSLHLALGRSWMATKGYAAPEVEHAYARARELCHHMGETPRLLQVLMGLMTFYFGRAALQTAWELGERCLLLAQHASDTARLQQVHLTLGTTLFHLGALTQAREHLHQGIALYIPQQSRTRAVQDPGVACHAYAAWVLWILGYPDQARQQSQVALTLAQQLAHPLSQVYALLLAATLHQHLRDTHAIGEHTEAGIAFSTEQEFQFWKALGTVLRGWLLAQQGQRDEGLEQISQGIKAWRATGAEMLWPYLLGLYAEVHGNVGHVDTGLRLLDEALTVVDKHDEHLHQAELHRLKGVLLLQQALPDMQQAEACFQQALAVAHHQQAKSWELRAAMSLSRLWQRQGKRDAARQVLAPVYGWFTEGFDTADLQEAKALLEALGQSS
jgi:predicted ATPase